MIIVGLNKDSIEVHIVNAYKNEYINKFHIIENIEKAIEKIKTAKEIYECEDIILDEKTISKSLLTRIEEENLVQYND
jgi:rubrerythrin